MNAHSYGGAFNALANYWLTKINLVETCQRGFPEYSLLGCEGCIDALMACLKHRATPKDESLESGFRQGFELGLEVARAMLAEPFDCEAILRELLDWKARELVSYEMFMPIKREAEDG